MRLNKLVIDNFGIIKNKIEIDFNDGMHLFSAKNGNGKSTINKAILLLLFNYTEKPLDEYINWGSKKNNFDLYLEFEHLGSMYTITYNYDSKKKSSRELVVNYDSKETYTNSNAVNKLAEIIDPKLSMNSIISMQNKMTLIDTKPAERREYLKKIYDLTFDREVGLLDERIKSLKNDKQVDISNEIMILESKDYTLKSLYVLPFDEDTYNNMVTEKDAVTSDINNLKKELEILLVNNNKKVSLKSKYDKLTTDFIKYSDQLNKLNVDLSRYSENLRILNIDAEINSLKLKIDDIELDYSTKRDRLISEKTSIVLRRLPLFDDSKIDNVNNEIYKIRADINQLVNNRSLLKQGICPTCKKECGDNDIASIEKQIKDLKYILADLESTLDNYKKEKNKYEADKTENENNRNRIVLIDNELVSLDQNKNLQVESLNKDVESVIKSDIVNRTHLLSLIDNTKENIENITNIKNDIKNNTDETKLELESIKVEDISDISQAIQQKQSLLLSITNNINNYASIIIQNKEIDKFNDAIANDKKQSEKKLTKLKKDLDKLVVEISEYEESKKILQKDLPNYIITRFILGLQDDMNDFLLKTYPKYTIAIEEKKDSIYCLYTEHKKDVSLASGYEQQIFSLAWLYALSNMTNLKLLILDEPDSNADEENAELFYRTLGSISSLYNQILLISHKDSVKSLLLSEYNSTVFELKDGNLAKFS